MNTFKSWIIANLNLIYILIQILIFFCLLIASSGSDNSTSSSFSEKACIIIGLFTVIVLVAEQSWIITSLLLIFLGVFAAYSFTNKAEVSSSIGIGIIIGCVIAIILAVPISICAYKNFGEIVSKRYLYRNSNAKRFEDKWKYSLDRLKMSFWAIYCIISETIILILN